METHPDNLARSGPAAGAQSQTKGFVWPLALVTVLMFNHIWWDTGGFTFRLIDLVLLGLLGIQLLQALRAGRWRYVHSALNKPLLLWLGVLLLGALVTQFRPVLAVDQQDAIVNSARLALAITLFFVVSGSLAHTATDKTRTVFYTVIAFSFVTTLVSLLQIAHWAGRLPFNLPAVLVTFKEGANQEPGREIFALFVGNSGTHVWSAMLAFQAICVWIATTTTTRSIFWRVAGYGYFVVLGLILVRTSVRNSILGLVVAVVFLSLLRAFKSRYVSTRLIIPALIVGGALLGVMALVTFAPEQYFVQRLVQTIPRLTGQEIVIDRASNIFGRLEYAQVGVAIFQRYPLLGGGFYSYRTYYLGMTRDTTISHAHNSYVQTMAELGLVGLLALAWLAWRIFSFLAVAGNGILQQAVWERRAWYLATSVAVFMAFTAGFANPFWEPTEVGFFMIALALASRHFWERT